MNASYSKNMIINVKILGNLNFISYYIVDYDKLKITTTMRILYHEVIRNIQVRKRQFNLNRELMLEILFPYLRWRHVHENVAPFNPKRNKTSYKTIIKIKVRSVVL